MATVSINDAKILRFDDGGKITITPAGSADDLVVLNVLPSSVRMKRAVRDTVVDMDRGVPKTDIRSGDLQPAELDFDCKYTSSIAAEDIERILNADLDTGYQKKFAIIIDWYDGPNQLTGVRHTFANAVRREACEVRGGSEFDTINARFIAPSGPTTTQITA